MILALLLAGCPEPRPPNFVLVTLDTTRADAVGVYRGDAAGTPNLNALAREGVRFDRAYSVTPLTIPAHSSIHTGLYPPRHGVRDNGDYFLGDDASTLAERLSAAGWATGASVGAEVTSHHWGFAQGFDHFADDLGPARRDRWAVERPAEEVVGDALRWLGQQGTDRPWFLWVHLFDAHHPYQPPEWFASLFPTSPYQAEVYYVDFWVGRLRQAILDRGDADRTWVVVVADHGEGLGDHGEGTHGVLLYDATVRIPFLVTPPPGQGHRGVVDTPVSLVDVTPTLLDLAGLPATGFDGRSLRPQIQGEAGDAGREVIAESLYAFHHYGWAPQRAIVSQTDKLIDSTTPELYLRGDALERDDQAPGNPARVTSQRARLDALYAELTPTGASRAASLSPEQIAQLEALGYLTTQATPTDGALPTGLPDPRTHLPALGRVEAGRQAMQRGDLVEARSLLEAVIADEPGLADPQMLLVQVLLRAGEVDTAEARLRTLAEQGRSGAQSMLGALLLQRGRAAEAVPVLRDAVETDPYLLSAWLPYLHALLATGDPTFATEVDRAWAALPGSVEVGGLAGFVAATRGDMATARPLLDAALADNPNQPLLNHGRGLVLAAAGDVVGAEAAFEEEVRLFPPAPASRRELVKLYADQRRQDEQLAQLAVLRELFPRDAPTAHSEAQALYNLGRYPEAETVVRRCRDLAPAYPGCAMLEANVLEKLGQHDEAVAAYHAALELAGQSPPEGATPSTPTPTASPSR